LLLEQEWGAADPLGFEVERDLNAVGNADEWYTAIHAKLFAIEGHLPLDLANVFSVRIINESEGLGL
jgi:hypothetical protein